MESDHWDPFFDDLYLKTYAALERGGDPEGQALAAMQLVGCEPGADVLDAPCGYGRHSIPLARAGYRIVGADRSEALLAEARRRAGDCEWPRWVQADHRDLPFDDRTFDAVLNLFTSLGYRGEEGDRDTLGQFQRVLRPGGALVVETMHRDRLMSIFQPRAWDPLPEDGILVEDRRFDHMAGEIDTTHTMIDSEGRRESFAYRMRLYTATELARLAEDAGFTEIECFGDLDREPLSQHTRLVLVARSAR
jgi:ubiquinone/menaquinone biosynthesis C-methylase UbiE